jgi:hypothetical protein
MSRPMPTAPFLGLPLIIRPSPCFVTASRKGKQRALTFGGEWCQEAFYFTLGFQPKQSGQFSIYTTLQTRGQLAQLPLDQGACQRDPPMQAKNGGNAPSCCHTGHGARRTRFQVPGIRCQKGRDSGHGGWKAGSAQVRAFGVPVRLFIHRS